MSRRYLPKAHALRYFNKIPASLVLKKLHFRARRPNRVRPWPVAAKPYDAPSYLLEAVSAEKVPFGLNADLRLHSHAPGFRDSHRAAGNPYPGRQ